MGSSREANIDTTVGGLVWVRRRNGSWWPGRILGPDELPEGCLLWPRRTGTPVKLLGREDASVDWYNLEKSKRVKAFRCGEYDECIERAKATANISCKKAVKYARREDAILHALEIENSRLSNNNNNNNPETISQTEKTENTSDKLSGLEFISAPLPEISRTGASADNPLEGITRQTPNESEDDGTGGKKRMRGLHDLGVGRAVSSIKKKRTRVVQAHDFLKKKNRRRQLTKVLKKTEMVTIPVMCEELAGVNGPDAKVWGLEYNELKGSFPDSTGDITNNINASSCKQNKHENSSISELQETDDSSGRLFDVPFVREEKQTADSSALVPETGQVRTRPQSGQGSLVETISVGPDEFQESGSVSSGADISRIIYTNGSSKWQHKGKRKSRNKSKTKTMQSFLTQEDDQSREVNNTIEVTGPQRFMNIHQPCSTVNPKYEVSSLAYKRTDAGSLFDVNVDVKSGGFPRHIPYISLLSNFTSQPVTGHSLEVEVLNDAVSDLSLNSSECLSSSCELDGVNEDGEMVPEASKRLRKNGPLSNKKIRKLSSLTGSKIPIEKEMFKKPDLACVPLKVVFGRINAALGISSAEEGLT